MEIVILCDGQRVEDHGASCTGTVTVVRAGSGGGRNGRSAASKVLGRVAYRVAPGSRKTVKLRLAKAARKRDR